MSPSPAESGGKPVAASRLRRWQAAIAALGVMAPLVWLAACGGADRTPSVAAIVPPPVAPAMAGPARFAADGFVADDGVRLPLRKWLPGGPVKAVILALHGFGDYSHGFEAPATIWAARGIATYAYDQRGFGATPGHGLWPGEGRLAVDAITASRLLRRAYPGRPLYILGESMGGAVASLVMTGALHGVVPGPEGMPRAEADGVILSAPAVWGREAMDFLPKLLLFAGVRLFPDMMVTGRGLRIMASDNLPMLRALARDPLVLKGARIDTVYGLVDLMDDALAAAPRLAVPTLLLYGAHDQIIPRAAIADFAARLPPDPGHRRRLAYYANGYHLLLRDLEGPLVAADVASWIFDPAAPLPSHADAGEDAAAWPPADKPE
jgi:alpha-beta hydrolase superfamily lysophospholipase